MLRQFYSEITSGFRSKMCISFYTGSEQKDDTKKDYYSYNEMFINRLHIGIECILYSVYQYISCHIGCYVSVFTVSDIPFFESIVYQVNNIMRDIGFRQTHY